MGPTLRESPAQTILVVEDDPQLRRLLRDTLEPEGYTVVLAATGEEGVECALRYMPQLLLLDLMLPGINGFQVVEQLRANVKTAHIPVVILSARQDTADKIRAFESQVDDYLTKPYNSDELLARIRTQLRHVQETLLSPLTRLPSGLRVERAIEQQVHTRSYWAILYLDLDNFKAYNDAHGFLRGNELIRLLATVSRKAVESVGNVTDFLGHIGGDDFVIITTPDMVQRLSHTLIEYWNRESFTTSAYSVEELQRGALVAYDRQGHQQVFSLVTLSIGVVTNVHRTITSLEEVSRTAAEVKRKAKSINGSSYYVDQRGTSASETAIPY
jgi:diguanylate cyclase (GGDEF)-like protein